MLQVKPLVRTDDFAIRAVSCPGGGVGWSTPEQDASYGVVLVRSGLFRLRGRGREILAEPTMAYLTMPGSELEFAHPAGGDVCTSLTVSPELWHAEPAIAGAAAGAAGQPSASVGPGIPVDGRLALAHLRLLRAARTGDTSFGVAERLFDLLVMAIRSARAHRGAAPAAHAPCMGDSPSPCVGDSPYMGHAPCSGHTRPAGHAPCVGDSPCSGDARRAGHAPYVGRSRCAVSGPAARLAIAAREAILADDPAAGSLTSLAARLAVSPFHLSRTFQAQTGITLTRYRNRVRVSRALARLDGGETDLARLAVDLGFADQAHLTRTVKSATGHPPGRVRHLLCG